MVQNLKPGGSEMKKLIIFMVLAALTLYSSLALGDDSAKATELVKKAVATHKKVGGDKFLEEIVKVNYFKDSGLYVFIYDLDGNMLAHPNPSLVGKNTLNAPDVKGKLFRKEIIETVKSKGAGWIDYHYENPKTKAIEEKTTYCEKADDMAICCGIYKK